MVVRLLKGGFRMHSVAWWPTVIAVSIAAISDVRSRRIPNWLVFPFLLSGIFMSALQHGWNGLGQSLLGILVAAVPMGLLYWLGGMGMGDVKLCAAIGAWIGPGQIGIALVVMGVAGGVMALLWAWRGGFLEESLDAAGDLVCGKRVLPNAAKRKLPYAPAIAFGALFSFLAVGK
jgi:prepilin peptidase CpaA